MDLQNDFYLTKSHPASTFETNKLLANTDIPKLLRDELEDLDNYDYDVD